MLACGAVRYTRLAILIQDELIWTFAFVSGDTRLAVSFEQVRTSGWCNKTEMRATTVILGARIIVGQLSKRMIDVDIVGSMRSVAQHLQTITGELFRLANRF